MLHQEIVEFFLPLFNTKWMNSFFAFIVLDYNRASLTASKSLFLATMSKAEDIFEELFHFLEKDIQQLVNLLAEFSKIFVQLITLLMIFLLLYQFFFELVVFLDFFFAWTVDVIHLLLLYKLFHRFDIFFDYLAEPFIVIVQFLFYFTFLNSFIIFFNI